MYQNRLDVGFSFVERLLGGALSLASFFVVIESQCLTAKGVLLLPRLWGTLGLKCAHQPPLTVQCQVREF